MVPPPAPKGAVPKLELIYFPLEGRAESARLICAIGGIPLEERVMTIGKWPERKKDFPYGALPVLIIDENKIIPQHVAICRYLGKLAKLTGKHTLEDAKIDAVVDACNADFNPALTKIFPVAVLNSDAEELKRTLKGRLPDEMYKSLEGNQEALRGAWKDFVDSVSPTLDRFEEMISKNYNGWLVSEKMTWGDVYVAEWLRRVMAHIEPDKGALADKYPHIRSMVRKVYANPAVAEYKKNGPKYPM